MIKDPAGGLYAVGMSNNPRCGKGRGVMVVFVVSSLMEV